MNLIVRERSKTARAVVGIVVYLALIMCGSRCFAADLTSSEFKLQLHALVNEALILHLKTPSLQSPRTAVIARKIRWDAQARLSESLRSATALLSMLEIAEHSDQGPRVREILFLWLDSSQRVLAEHLNSVEAAAHDAPLDPSTAEFLEELKILWQRLDGAYADLQAMLAVPGSDARPANS